MKYYLFFVLLYLIIVFGVFSFGYVVQEKHPNFNPFKLLDKCFDLFVSIWRKIL